MFNANEEYPIAEIRYRLGGWSHGGLMETYVLTEVLMQLCSKIDKLEHEVKKLKEK